MISTIIPLSLLSVKVASLKNTLKPNLSFYFSSTLSKVIIHNFVRVQWCLLITWVLLSIDLKEFNPLKKVLKLIEYLKE